mgnify:CR=1 FL=1
MKRVAAYCRFSSSNQREESIDAQVRAIREYCDKNNLKLIKIYKDEAISGTSTKDREMFLEMILDCKKNLFDYVIVHKYDRFARNRYDHILYEKILNDNNVKLISVLEQLADDSPESIILKSVLAGMNEYYSKNLSREVKKGKKENALKALHNGGIPPLGYDIDENRKYIVNKKEAEVVKLIFQLALDGVGYVNIANILNEKGYKNKKGKEFRKISIRDTLLNIKYIGTYYYGLKDGHGKLQKEPIIIENSHEPIIDKDIFYKIQAKMKKNLKGPRNRNGQLYFLTGYCVCGECGGSFSGGYRSVNRNGSISYGYYCQKRKRKETKCNNKAIRKELLETFIFDIIKKEVFNDEKIEKMIKDIISFSKSKNLKKKQEIEEYTKEIEKLQKMTLRLLEKNLEGNILDETFNIKNAELKEKIEVLREKIYSIKNITKINEEELREYLKNFKESANDYAKRKVIESFVQEIRVYGDKIKIAFRKFPKDLDMVKIGGDEEINIITINRNLLYNKAFLSA